MALKSPVRVNCEDGMKSLKHIFALYSKIVIFCRTTETQGLQGK